MTIKQLVELVINNMAMATPIVVVSKDEIGIKQALLAELVYATVGMEIQTQNIITVYGYSILLVYGMHGISMVVFTSPHHSRLPDFFKHRAHIVSDVELTNSDAELAAYEVRDAQDASAYEDVNMGSGVSSTDEVSDADKRD